jgi:hypothetical protein
LSDEAKVHRVETRRWNCGLTFTLQGGNTILKFLNTQTTDVALIDQRFSLGRTRRSFLHVDLPKAFIKRFALSLRKMQSDLSLDPAPLLLMSERDHLQLKPPEILIIIPESGYPHALSYDCAERDMVRLRLAQRSGHEFQYVA